jgi:hypothetical protein
MSLLYNFVLTTSRPGLEAHMLFISCWRLCEISAEGEPSSVKQG